MNDPEADVVKRTHRRCVWLPHLPIVFVFNLTPFSFHSSFIFISSLFLLSHTSAMASTGTTTTTHHVLLLLLLLLSVTIHNAGAQTPGDPNATPLDYNRFNPSMAVIIVVLVAALFFMAFFSIYIRQCSETSVGAVRPLNGIAVGRSRRAARGLDPAVIETFPTLLYSAVKGLKVGKGALECAVCLNEFEDDETLRLIPKCDHVFHPDCIDAWLVSHTTCPVCRTNLVPEPAESTAESNTEPDIEAQNDVPFRDDEVGNHAGNGELQPVEPEVMNLNATLNRNRTRRSRSGRPRKFLRSHSTGHSIIQPGEDTERFTLRLPVEVRKQIMNRQLNRATSLVVLPREGSSRRGYRTGVGEGSSRGKGSRWIDRSAKSDRWLFNMTPPSFMRALSFQSLRSAKPVGKDQETMAQPLEPGEQFGDSAARPPV